MCPTGSDYSHKTSCLSLEGFINVAVTNGYQVNDLGPENARVRLTGIGELVAQGGDFDFAAVQIGL